MDEMTIKKLLEDEERDECELIKKYIVSDPEILLGVPVIKGTRISVPLILEMLASGMKIDEIASVLNIPKESIIAAIIYAKRLVEEMNVEVSSG